MNWHSSSNFKLFATFGFALSLLALLTLLTPMPNSLFVPATRIATAATIPVEASRENLTSLTLSQNADGSEQRSRTLYIKDLATTEPSSLPEGLYPHLLAIQQEAAKENYPSATNTLLYQTQLYTQPVTGESGDSLGEVVALSRDGNLALIGVPGKTGQGAVFVLSRPNATSSYTLTQVITHSDVVNYDYFGSQVALSGDNSTAMIGARSKNATQGAVYIFTRTDENSFFTQTQVITNMGRSTVDIGRDSIALSNDGNTALIGDYSANNWIGATYVFTRSSGLNAPFVQSQVLTASNPLGTGIIEGDELGWSVALSKDGNTALIGAPGRFNNQGAAYIFTRSPGGNTAFTEAQFITPTDKADNDRFGWSVALNGDASTALVSAKSKNGERGAAYIFTRSVGSSAPFSQSQILTASDSASGDYFGQATTLSEDGSTALIGASRQNGLRGATYVFTRSEIAPFTFVQSQILTASNPAFNDSSIQTDFFGASVALSNDGNVALISKYYGQGEVLFYTRTTTSNFMLTQIFRETRLGSRSDDLGAAIAMSADGNFVLVSAPGKRFPEKVVFVFSRPDASIPYTISQLITFSTSGIVGEEIALSSDGKTAFVSVLQRPSERGTVHVLTREGASTTFTHSQILTPPNPVDFDEYGQSIALSSDGNTALVGVRNNNGVAYIYTRPGGLGTAFVQSQILTVTSPTYFGYSVALSNDGNIALIGAPVGNGSAYVFIRSGGINSTFAESQVLTPSYQGNYADFGRRLALSGDGKTAVIGATGVMTDQGAVYVFTSSSGATPAFTQPQIIMNPNISTRIYFGLSLALSKNGETLLIGARNEDAQGIVYNFSRSGGVGTPFVQVQSLTAPYVAKYDEFGSTLALNADGSAAVIKASLNDYERLYFFSNIAVGCDPLVVTLTNDDGTGNICGTFSAALKAVTATQTVTFALTGDGNTITFTGALLWSVPNGVTLDGDSAVGIVLNGNGVTGDGLRLSGNVTLKNLTIRQFGKRELVTLGNGNKLIAVRLIS
jgi:hypothetical protein